MSRKKDKEFISEVKKVLGLSQEASEADVFVAIGRIMESEHVRYTTEPGWTTVTPGNWTTGTGTMPLNGDKV